MESPLELDIGSPEAARGSRLRLDDTPLQNPATPDGVAETADDLPAGRPPRSGYHARGPVAFARSEIPGHLGKLGKYRILKLLGQGGMGAVYQAFDDKLKRKVALKVLLPEAAGDPRARVRFLREARAAARVSSDHVVSIYEADEIAGVAYIAQQYLQGKPLDLYLKERGSVRIYQAVRIARETAQGLAAAHALGLVHRDIKPANLWLEAPKGRVKILDFGLARHLDDDATASSAGMMVGTPAYMAPEQARCEKVDARSDLFSLGAVLYFLLTNRFPFPGNSSTAVLLALATREPVPIRQINDAVDPELAELAHILLAKDPAQRPRDAAEVVEALDWIERNRHAGRPVDQAAVIKVEYVPLDISCESPNVWDDLDSETTEAAATKSQPGTPPRRRPRYLALAAGLLGAAALAGIAYFASKSATGTLVVESDDPAAEIVLKRDGAIVRDRTKDREIPLSPGEYSVELAEKRDGLHARPNRITVVRDRREVLHITADRPKPPNRGEEWIRAVAALPPEKQAAEVVARLKALNPGYDGRAKSKIADGAVVQLEIPTDRVKDLSPLRALVGLRVLACCGPVGREGPADSPRGILVDLSPLAGLKLRELNVSHNRIADLAPLKGMPLHVLNAPRNRIADLAPLGGSTLASLDVSDNPINDLAPLRDLKLADLDIRNAPAAALEPLRNMPLKRLAFNNPAIVDPAPLKGMMLEALYASGSGIADLAFIAPMPLGDLAIEGTPVRDLAPLAGRPLKELRCGAKPAADAKFLRQNARLERINYRPAAEFWKDLDAGREPKPWQNAKFDDWARGVALMAPEVQVEAVAAALIAANPCYNGEKIFKVEGDAVAELAFNPDYVTDLSPVRALHALKGLICNGPALPGKQPAALDDLAPLAGMKLRRLECANTQVADLSPLRSLKLEWLSIPNTQVADLAPLRGMPLLELNCGAPGVSDLSPLAESRLRKLLCHGSAVADLSPVKDLKLSTLVISHSKVASLAPLSGMPLSDLSMERIPAIDLEPLRNLPLKRLVLDAAPGPKAALLASIKTLETVNGEPAAAFFAKIAVPSKH